VNGYNVTSLHGLAPNPRIEMFSQRGFRGHNRFFIDSMARGCSVTCGLTRPPPPPPTTQALLAEERRLSSSRVESTRRAEMAEQQLAALERQAEERCRAAAGEWILWGGGGC